MTQAKRYDALSDAPTDMGSLITCVARSFAATSFHESVAGNKDLWITELWACYHKYGNYGAYCVVGAYAIVKAAYDIASTVGKLACFHNFPTKPNLASRNKERTLYGNVYRTYQEIVIGGDVLTGSEPEVGAVFFRASNDRGFNHAGVVIEVPRTENIWIRTVEANTSVSGNSGAAKGFVVVEYSRAAYEAYQSRPFVKPSDASRSYGSESLSGWRYAYFNRGCNFPASISVTGFVACPGVMITCEEDQLPTPAPPACDILNPPDKGADGDLYTEWTLTTNEYPKHIKAPVEGGAASVIPRPGRGDIASGYIQLSSDGCWIRYRKSMLPPSPGSLPPEKQQSCKDTYLLQSACDPDTGSGKRTVLRFASAGDVLTLADMSNRGGREALFSSVINRTEFMGRGYDSRARTGYDAVPMLQLANTVVFNLVESAELYKVFAELSLWGPNPHFLYLNRLGIPGGSGGGFAERLAGYFAPDNTQELVFQEGTESAGLYRNLPTKPLRTCEIRDVMGNCTRWGYIGDFPQTTLRDYLDRYDRSQADTKRPLVILWRGEPVSGWDAIKGPLKVISSLIPGVGPLVAQISPVIDQIVSGSSTGIDVAFSLTNALAGALGSGVLGDKPFGVDGSVFRDIASNSQKARRVYGHIQRGGSVVGVVAAVATEFDRQFPDVTRALRAEFADEERWIRNAASEVERVWNGTLGDIRSTVHGFADGVINERMAGLTQIAGSVDAAFASVLGSANTVATSASQLWFIQELLTTKPDASVLSAVPGANRIVANILGVESFFRTDVTSSATHAALAGIASGKKVFDGALDGLTLSSLINKAEDFARKNWDYELPSTLPEDKRECFAHEIRVVTGLECCAPKQQFCGVCLDPSEVAPCPEGQVRDSDGCCIEVPRSSGNTGTTTDTGRDGASTGGPTLPPAITSDKPDSVPSCIIAIAERYYYCPPASCRTKSVEPPRTTTPDAIVWEESTIKLVNAGGAPFQLRARRKAGSGATWQDFAVRAMQPAGNDWVESTTSFVPASSSDIVPGSSMSPDLFESMRASQGAEVMRAESLGDMLGMAFYPFHQGLSADMSAYGMVEPKSNSWPTTTTTQGQTGSVATTRDLTATCAVRYSARYSAQPYPRWFALIGAEWIEIVDCCPKQEGQCCDETKGLVIELRKDIQRLTEYVHRMGAGEPLDISDVRRDIQMIKETVLKPVTKYDDAALLERISDLERTVRAIKLPATYDDSSLKLEIAGIKLFIEERMKPAEACKNYDTRFDEIEALVRSIVIPPPVVTGGGIVYQERDYTPLLLTIQKTIGELRTQTGPDYSARFEELRRQIDRLDLTCPTCTPQDMSQIHEKLDRIEKNTTRNYESEFASLRSLIESIRMDKATSYDERFDKMEEMIRTIRVNEATDYSERFARLEEIIKSLRVDCGNDRAYDPWFEAIVDRLDRLALPVIAEKATNEPTTSRESTQVSPVTAQNCDYRWDELLLMLRSIRERQERPSQDLHRETQEVTVPGASTPTTIEKTTIVERDQPFVFDAWYDLLQRKIEEATSRVVVEADRRYDELRLIIVNLQKMIEQRPSTTVTCEDPRIAELLRLVGVLQITTSSMSTSLEAVRRDLAYLTENMQKLNTAFTREITSLQTIIREQGGNVEVYGYLERQQAEWLYQRTRYEADINYLRQRLEACDQQPKHVDQAVTPTQTTSTEAATPQERVIDVVDRVQLPTDVMPPVLTTWPKVEPPVVQTPVVQTPVVQTPVVEPPVVQTPVVEPPVVQTPVVEPPDVKPPVVQSPVPPRIEQKASGPQTPCTDCPAVIERHERIIYSYPNQVPPQSNYHSSTEQISPLQQHPQDCDCDDCSDDC